MILYILLATIAISLISLVGIIVSYKHIKKFLHYFVSFAAGTLIAASFFDLIPHALHETGDHFEGAFLFVVAGILLFFLVERYIHWHHCDKETCEGKPAGFLILTGDFVHNFLDGVLIAGAFMLNVPTGIVTSITVAIHEIPQEFGDFAVLVHSGFKKKKALTLNFLSALSAVLGGIIGFFMFDLVEGIAPFAVLITAGGFLYIALSDIVPSLHSRKKNRSSVFWETLILVATVMIMYYLLIAIHSH